MPSSLKLDYSNMRPFIHERDLSQIQRRINEAHRLLTDRSGPGNTFLGWINLPFKTQRDFNSIIQIADEIKNEQAVLVCIGIGGSYLGTRAVIEAVRPESGAEIYYAGNHIDADSLADLMDILVTKKFYINVISKSGTTLEPSLAFRILKKLLETRPGVSNRGKYVIATTDKSKGLLKKYADSKGYRTLEIPHDVGGRFSVLTPVGLLPIAASGVDISELIAGARDMAERSMSAVITENDSYMYAALRNIMYDRGKRIEILANFKPALHFFCEWWKQLYGESEGKQGMGLFPASVDFTTDLHSLGQYIQDGVRNIMETFIVVERSNHKLRVPDDDENIDKLNYLAGTDIDEINQKAYIGTAAAHLDGGIPNMTITVPALTPHHIGQLLFFFEKAVAISGYLLGVNPFDQPGVEAYKNNMFRLLGKPD